MENTWKLVTKSKKHIPNIPTIKRYLIAIKRVDKNFRFINSKKDIKLSGNKIGVCSL